MTFFWGKTMNAILLLDNIKKVCQENSISEATHALAIELANKLPDWLPTPSVYYYEPDGIEMEWVKYVDRFLLITISDDGYMVHSRLNRYETATFTHAGMNDENLPAVVVDWLWEYRNST